MYKIQHFLGPFNKFTAFYKQINSFKKKKFYLREKQTPGEQGAQCRAMT